MPSGTRACYRELSDQFPADLSKLIFTSKILADGAQLKARPPPGCAFKDPERSDQLSAHVHVER